MYSRVHPAKTAAGGGEKVRWLLIFGRKVARTLRQEGENDEGSEDGLGEHFVWGVKECGEQKESRGRGRWWKERCLEEVISNTDGS